MQTVTDWKLGSAAANETSVGSVSITDPENVLIDNSQQINDGSGFLWWDLGSYAHLFYVGQGTQEFRTHDARLIVDGEVVGTNQASDSDDMGYVDEPIVDDVTIGGSSNVFGATLTPRDVRRNSFGVALSFCTHDISGGALAAQSHYLAVTGFDFDVPLDATITGIEIRFLPSRENQGGGVDAARVYYVYARVHYTYEPTLTGKSRSFGYIEVNEFEQPEISQQKHYQYLSFERNQFRGAWRDVISIPKILNQMNTLPGELPVQLARNLDSKEIEYDEIELSGYDGEVLVTTQNAETILGGEETTYGIGAGTDLEVDHAVKVKEFYGGWEALTLRNGEPILTHQLEPLQVPVGYPRGRMYFHGYVSDYGFNYGDGPVTTDVKLLHISDELNNEIYKTPDTIELDNYGEPGIWGIPFGGWFKYPGDIELAGFTFRAPSTFKLKRLVIATSGWRDNIITAVVRTGTTMGAGTIVGTASAQITKSGIMALSYAFPVALSLTNAADYNVVLTSEYQKQTGSQSHPAMIHSGALIANHAGFKYQDGSWSSAGIDIAFQLWEEGGETRVNELSIDPSQIQRKILDYNVANGGLITYTPSSIVDSNTVVSAPFNTNTLKEGGDYVLKLTPSDWFYYIDPGQLIYNLRPRPEVVNHWFTLGKDIIKFTPHKNIENIINETLFTGGGDPALFRRLVDTVSRSQWRKGLWKTADNRVTDATTADILMQSEMDRNSQPIWIGQLEVLRNEHPKMVHPGQLAGFRAFGNMLDTIQVQIFNVEVTHDRFVMQLGTQPPKTSQRIEDIKRNLTRLEIENNPNNPT